MRSIIPIGLLLACSAACTSSDDDPLPAPTEGTWHITRTVPTQPADCPALAPNPIDATFRIDSDTPIVLAESSTHLRDYDQSVNAQSAGFVTEDYAYPTVSGIPILIQHHLQVAGAGLTGTGDAGGDGDQLHCQYHLVLTATRP